MELRKTNDGHEDPPTISPDMLDDEDNVSNEIYDDEDSVYDDRPASNEIHYADSIEEVIDADGYLIDGPGAPRLREYPKHLPGDMGPKVRRLQPDGSYNTVYGVSYEKLKSRYQLYKDFMEELDAKPYDDYGYLKIFIDSPFNPEYYIELGSKASAEAFAESLRDKLANSTADVSYRDSTSADHGVPGWGNLNRNRKQRQIYENDVSKDASDDPCQQHPADSHDPVIE